jgi:Pseudomonas avirulence D protein (AvrD)
MWLPLSNKPSSRIEYTSIDEALGAADGRFFGGGYRRVHHDLRLARFETTAAGLWQACGKADVCYPGDWSRKSAASELRPHLSSIDAVALAARLAEEGLTRALNLDQEQCRRMWMRSITFRAGAEPLMNLADFDVSATVIQSAPELLSLCGQVSLVQCRIGPVKVTLEIEHEPGHPGEPPSDHLAGTSSGESGRGYFAGGYKATACEIRAVSADLEAGRIEALVKVSAPVTGMRLEGIGGAYHPCLTIIEGIAAMAQLAQVLTYATDNLRSVISRVLFIRPTRPSSTHSSYLCPFLNHG